MPRDAFKTLCALLIALVLIACFEQDSIARYWRQTYHEDAPLEFLKQNPVWAAGARLNEVSTQMKENLDGEMSRFDERLIAWFNDGKSAEGHSAKEASAGKPELLALAEQAKQPKHFERFSESVFQGISGTGKIVQRTTFSSEKPSGASPKKPQNPQIPSIAEKSPPENRPESLPSPESGTAPDENAPARNDGNDEIQLSKTDRVLFVGDSLMQGIAPHVNTSLYKRHAIHSLDLSKQSTGLAYPDLFNWPQLVKKTFLEKRNIKLMVVFLGPNDPWDFPHERGKPYLKFGSEKWESVYRGRIREMIEPARENGARVLWLASPCMRKKELNTRMTYLNTLFSDEVKNSRELFLPTSDLVGCDNGKFASFMNSGGKKIKTRLDDGIHFTFAGQKKIANEVLAFIRVSTQHADDSNKQPRPIHARKTGQ